MSQKGGPNLKQITIDIHDRNIDMQKLAGVENRNFTSLEHDLDVEVKIKGTEISLSGSDTEKAHQILELMIERLQDNDYLENRDILYFKELVETKRNQEFKENMHEILTRTFSGKPIRPKTIGQKKFIDIIKTHDLSFAIGPAGTGKTYLAVCYAVELLKQNQVKKIILTRPAVEAGENLGFLPGDLKEKVDPYLRPLYDALDDMLSSERTARQIEKGIIEIAPLAYMRGRTLDDAVIILDEAQNTSKAQMLMFLTRLGRNSKMIVTGDLSQIDLPKYQISGLKVAKDLLSNIPEIGIVELEDEDVVRHPLVIKILKRFAQNGGE